MLRGSAGRRSPPRPWEWRSRGLPAGAKNSNDDDDDDDDDYNKADETIRCMHYYYDW